ncbi:MAG TPA: GntR family transcriptional regulator [Bacillota bacterium]|jgi:DNA-binding GntR family transcriptional regulator|nr:GntR family transcriptional regulator [Bacillota bacterium]
MELNKFMSESVSSNIPLAGTLFVQLQKDILCGKLKPGQKLTEQNLCAEYNVSRTPVREALRQLEMDGLVENIPNRGAFVVGFTEQDMMDMYDLRKVYEMQAVRWAITRITDEELEALEETFEFMEFYTMKKDIEKMHNINIGFHQIIYNASHNRMLQHVLSSYQIYLKYKRRDMVYDDQYLPTVLAEHQAIFQAFRAKDPEAGVRAMEIHMDHSKKRNLL